MILWRFATCVTSSPLPGRAALAAQQIASEYLSQASLNRSASFPIPTSRQTDSAYRRRVDLPRTRARNSTPTREFLDELSRDSVQLRGALYLGIVPWLDVALVPQLLGLFAATYPPINLTVTEISSDDIETALEEGRMDVGLGFLTHHSPNLHYELLSSDEFVLIVPAGHPWWNRRMVHFSELHQQRLLQLPRRFVVRRMTDDICRTNLGRPRTVAEISAIETLLRSLAPLKAAALLPKVALRGTTGLKAIQLRGKSRPLEIGLLRLQDSSSNSTVAAFTELAKVAVPKILGERLARRRRSR